MPKWRKVKGNKVFCALVRSLPEGEYDYVGEEFEECVEEEVVDDGMQLLTANQLSRKAAMDARVWDEELVGAGTMDVDVDPPKDTEEEQ